MKNKFRLFLTCALLILNTALFANKVIVKGYIQDSNKNAIANKKVSIYTDSLSCSIAHTVTTNPNGYYIDSFECSIAITKLKITVENCNGTLLTNDPLVPLTNIVESNFIVCITQTPPPPTTCKAVFAYTLSGYTVKVNSAETNAPVGDSVISRVWNFGDSSAMITGNRVDPSHLYSKAGTYTTCLDIKTKNGCTSSYCLSFTIKDTSFVVSTNACNVNLSFNAERISLKTVRFNSSLSNAIGDTIIQRIWHFGDNTMIDGNQISPLKEFPMQGFYTTCLQVKTKGGCVTEICKTVRVQDSIALPVAAVDFVSIVSINPNPVATRMYVTLTSRNNNTVCELTIVDIYGMVKSSIKKTLLQGNNIIEIPTELLYQGPYFFTVSTQNSKDAKIFYKL
ncbi:MAG: PKD domain-containing protein [Sediminibacterium sp.]|jgi:PKD repeat protein